jgi:hypothetical protein
MKICTAIAVLVLLLLLLGCSGASSNPALGARIGGHDLDYLLRVHPDWSSTGEVVDEEYQLVPHAWVKGLHRVFGEDCDDYAGEMWRRAVNGPGRPAFGMVVMRDLDSAHALNFYVAPDKTLWLYEPQTGRHWKPSREEMWLMRGHWI